MSVMLNLFWILIAIWLVSILFRQQIQDGIATVQVILLLAAFLGPFLIAWIVSSLAADGRGPTYGIYGSLGGVIVLALIALPTGLFGMMAVIAAIAGGLNGGLFSLRAH